MTPERLILAGLALAVIGFWLALGLGTALIASGAILALAGLGLALERARGGGDDGTPG